ncbi:MAG: nucleotide sugar dehydrogenase [Gemmatimonadales bacterium]|nr:nucleotide sugar dehydrogenase [Gemmatimonadales bacterium]
MIGPGIVGVPMATLLARAGVRIGSDEPAAVVVIQRPSPTSGWKVDAINEGRSPIGGIEPALDAMLREAVASGRLSASHDCGVSRDADVVLICVQTDRDGNAPAYGPLFEALTGLAEALRSRPKGNVPLVIFESTLAPTSMSTVVRDHFARYGLVEGRDILLGNSPNRVMPGRLLERVATSDKLVAGLNPVTPALIARLYSHIVTEGTVYQTSSMTAEVVKTLENAYRDVRIAYAAEVARHCDAHDLDYYALRDEVNRRADQADAASRDPNAVPSGGLLIPTLGVGGHCLPKDGILLWWRALERGLDTSRSLILEARRINDDSPSEVLALMERRWGSLAGRSIALLGTAYRFNSEDTRNSPTLAFARLLLDRGCRAALHDPYVKPGDQNLAAYGLAHIFSNDLPSAVADADLLVVCTAHREYLGIDQIMSHAARASGLFDACNLLPDPALRPRISYAGIGRGRRPPPAALIDAVSTGFRAVERGVTNEVRSLLEFLNDSYAVTPFERVDFAEVQRLAATCGTGCRIVDAGPLEALPQADGFSSRLVCRAASD